MFDIIYISTRQLIHAPVLSPQWLNPLPASAAPFPPPKEKAMSNHPAENNAATDDDEDYEVTMEEVRATGVGFASADMGPSLDELNEEHARRRS